MNCIRRRAPQTRGNALKNYAFTGLALIAGAVISGCGSTAQMPSAWRARGVTIDSAARQWKSAFVPIKDTHLYVGIQNDSEYFYIRILAPEEEFQRRIAGPGLTVWFEPEDGKKVGVLYPMGTGIHDIEILGADKNDRTLFSPSRSARGERAAGERGRVVDVRIENAAPRVGRASVCGRRCAGYNDEDRDTDRERGRRVPRRGRRGGRTVSRGGRWRRRGRVRRGKARRRVRRRTGREVRGSGGGTRYDPVDFKADIHLAPPPSAPPN